MLCLSIGVSSHIPNPLQFPQISLYSLRTCRMTFVLGSIFSFLHRSLAFLKGGGGRGGEGEEKNKEKEKKEKKESYIFLFLTPLQSHFWSGEGSP